MQTRLTSRKALPTLAGALALSLLGHGGLLLLRHDATPTQAKAQATARSTARIHISAVAPTRLADSALSTPPAPPTSPTSPEATQATHAKSTQQTVPSAASMQRSHPSQPEPGASVIPALEAGSAGATLSLPSSGEWHYLLSQQGRAGRAVLRWELASGGAYALSLAREVEGRPLPGWRSQGRVQAQGLAPQRFVQLIRGRERSALNFRREQGLISFSASDELLPLEDGLQDGLSWLLQLASLAQSQADEFRPGQVIALRVAGLRGLPQDWIFEVIAPDGAGTTASVALLGARPKNLSKPLLHLRRRALNEYSGEVEVWLDPQRQHLPVRLHFQLPEERGWTLQLQPGPAGETSAPASREAP